MKIQIITTGGTIDKIYFDKKSEFQVGEPQITEVLTEANVTFDYEVLTLMEKDSLDFTDKDRALIRDTVQKCKSKRVLVTHGTDTMVKTASVLEGLEGKTIVLTGALAPARFRVTDAVFNIGCAIAAVQLLPAGVYVAMNGRVFASDNVRKNSEENIFEESKAK